MSHHSDLQRTILGSTGKHTEGQLSPHDEGDIRFAVTAVDGNIVLAFGKPVAWIGFNPADARALVDSIERRLKEAEEQIKVMVADA